MVMPIIGRLLFTPKSEGSFCRVDTGVQKDSIARIDLTVPSEAVRGIPACSGSLHLSSSDVENGKGTHGNSGKSGRGISTVWLGVSISAPFGGKFLDLMWLMHFLLGLHFLGLSGTLL